MERRRFLRASVGGAVAVLAGCAGDGSGTDTTTTATTTTAPAETTTTEATTTEATSATGTPTETPTTTTTAPTTTEAPQSSVEVAVGANGRSRFSPEAFRLERGGTVTWVWEGNAHNAIPSEQPDEADWSGTPGDTQTYDEGYEYEYTFEVPGDYAYYCSVHRGIGMTGSFTVVEP
ncbi:halocyanin [Halobacteriales archaeon QS_8_69_26]|nr:MAG: halocyanin [Halobacteriales archaeon QS_8_69_26]